MAKGNKRKKDERRLKHLENQSQDFGRYGRNPRETPQKPLSTTQTKQSKEDIAQNEIKEKLPRMKDPVCGKIVNPETSDFYSTYEKGRYAFCCQKCLDAFEENPTEYI